jgi:Fur family ferric uptake transcriptional regulator
LILDRDVPCAPVVSIMTVKFTLRSGEMARRARPGKARRAVPDRGDGSARRADLEARLRSLGMKRSAVRDAVVEAFFGAPGHISLEELVERARAAAPRVGHSTAYRTMKLLVDTGFAAARDFGGSRTRFERVGAGHHDHLVCTRCGAISEFEEPAIEELQERVAREFGFDIDSHKLELYGRCARCGEAGGRPLVARRSG